MNSIKSERNTVAWRNLLPALPLVSMCIVIISVLLCDLLWSGMADAQYTVFPAIFRVSDAVMICLGIGCLGYAAYKKEIKPGITTGLFAAFAVLIVISTMVNGLTAEAVRGIPYRHIGIFNMLAFLLIYMGVSARPEGEDFKEKALLLFPAVSDVIGITVLADLLITDIPAYNAKKELSAVFFNGNHYGYFLLMAALIGAAWFIYSEGWRRIFGAASAALNLLLLSLNHSMGSVLAFALVIAGMAVCAAFFERSKLRIIAVMCAAIAAFLVLGMIISPALRNEFASLTSDIAALLSSSADGSAGHNRMMLWDLTAGCIREKPLLGHGCEGIAFMMYAATGRSNPHNEILTYAAYYGIPAALCYLAGVLSIFAAYFRSRQKAELSSRIACLAAAGYLLSSLTGVAMFYTTPFFFIFLGMTGQSRT